MSRVTTCTNHCSQCGRHFHSVAAFDIHLARDETGWPVCLDPIDLEDRDGRPRLEVLSTEGECRMYDDGSGTNIKRPVMVWTTAGTAERVRAMLEHQSPNQ